MTITLEVLFLNLLQKEFIYLFEFTVYYMYIYRVVSSKLYSNLGTEMNTD